MEPFSIFRTRRGSRHIANLDPDPLRSPEDATETGLIIGVTGAPWIGAVAKNLKDRRLATRASVANRPRRAGRSQGRRAGQGPGEPSDLG